MFSYHRWFKGCGFAFKGKIDLPLKEISVIIIINNAIKYVLLPSVISYTGYRWDWNVCPNNSLYGQPLSRGVTAPPSGQEGK